MRHRQSVGHNAVLVIGLVIGVLVMHGMGDPSMNNSGMAMSQPQMPHQTTPMAAGVSQGHDMPVAPGGEMAMAAICAFAVLLLIDRVTRRGLQPTQRWAQSTVHRSRLLVGPEPPVPKPV